MAGNGDRIKARAKAERIMLDFGHLTGLDGQANQSRRYLWTDAFAVCCYLELFCQTENELYRDLVLRLVDQVHHTLGRHRPDDPRQGWISGLEDEEGERHPTIGGLRIGKSQNERCSAEPFDDRLEWDRDGQYYHYLTKWMHALNCVSRVTGDPAYWRWAMDLARAAHRSFRYGKERMYWKMSIDLSRPLVASMGQHDPLDGYVTYCELEAGGEDFHNAPSIDLKEEISEMAGICRKISLPTSDPLGIGGLLFDGSRIAQLMMLGSAIDGSLLERVLGSALVGLEAYASMRDLDRPAGHRLAFRELGLSIGLSAVEEMVGCREERPDLFTPNKLNNYLDSLFELLPLREKIEEFWQEERNQQASTWGDHQEINMVTLACSLAPGQFLLI